MRAVAGNLVATAPAVDGRKGEVVDNVGCYCNGIVGHTPDGKVARWDDLTAEQNKLLSRFLILLRDLVAGYDCCALSAKEAGQNDRSGVLELHVELAEACKGLYFDGIWEQWL